MGAQPLTNIFFYPLEIIHSKKKATEQKKRVNYYPFGLQHKGYNNIVNPSGNSVAQKFGFGGKELSKERGINWYDFGARNYDASIGRWMNVDPLSEKYYGISGYNYAINNPLRYIDPDGRDIIFSGDFDEEYRNKIVNQLKKVTGLDLSVNKKGKLIYNKKSKATKGSKKARSMLMGVIDDKRNIYNVENKDGEGSKINANTKVYGKEIDGEYGQTSEHTINMDSEQTNPFENGVSDNLNPSTMGGGMIFLHEVSHQYNRFDDAKGIYGLRGPNVDFMNEIRTELNESKDFNKTFGQRLSYESIKGFVPFSKSSYNKGSTRVNKASDLYLKYIKNDKKKE